MTDETVVGQPASLIRSSGRWLAMSLVVVVLLLVGGAAGVADTDTTAVWAEDRLPQHVGDTLRAEAATLASAPATTTLTAVADTILYSASPTSNYGGSAAGYCGAAGGITNGLPCLFRFDLSAIPNQAIVHGATLHLYSTSQVGPGWGSYAIYALRRSWTEMGATWNTSNGSTPWGTAGAENTTSDREATASSSASIYGSPAHWSSFDVTELVQRWVNGDLANNGLKLQKISGDVTSIVFNMREADTNRPSLVVVWSPPHTPTPSNTPTQTGTPTQTATPTQTGSPTNTATVTRTPTPSHTATETRTPTITNTPTSTATATVTRTPTATRTHTITPTPTLDPAYNHTVTFQQYLQPNSSFDGCADATLVEYEPDYPHTASGIYLRMSSSGIEKTGLQKWDLSPWISAWSTILEAQLHVYVVTATNVGDIQVSLYPLIRTWIADQATWNNATDEDRWGIPGAKSTVSDISGTVAASAWLLDPGQWYSFDVTALAQQWVSDPASNKGVVLRVTAATTSVEFQIAGCRYAYGASVRPLLVVTYNDYYPGNTPTPTATPTGTQTPQPHWTPTHTKTPRPTFTFTRTRTRTPTQTATATPSPTVTHTPTVTSTPTQTPTPTVTATVTQTPTTTKTATVTWTPKPTYTFTPTATEMPTLTTTPSQTPTPTVTLTPTLTDTPTETLTPTVTPTSCADSYEPDDTPATAAPIIANAPPQQHNFHAPGDVDWQVFTGMPGYTYVVRTLNLAGGADTVVCLYDSDAVSVLACDDDGGDEPFASRIGYSFPASGAYYIAVSNHNPRAGGCSMTYQIELTSAAFTPTATATASPTATHTPTVTSTPTATRTPLLSIYLPIIMLDEAPGG